MNRVKKIRSDQTHNMHYTIGPDLREKPVEEEDFKKGLAALMSEVKALGVGKARAKQCSLIGVWSRIIGDLGQSTAYLNAASKDLEKLDLVGNQLWKANEIRKAQTLQFQGAYEQANDIYNALLTQIALAEKEETLLDFIYQHQGKNYYEQGDLVEAIKLIEKAKMIRVEKGDKALLDSSLYALKVMKEKRLENYQEVSRIFVERMKELSEVIGIIICGSLSRSDLDLNSDIDVYVILSPEMDFRERGNTWINGIEVEYFRNSPQQIRAYYLQEKKSPHTADMIGRGQVVYENSPEIGLLRGEAQAILAAGPAKLSNVELELAKYFLDDRYKDWADSIATRDYLGGSLLRMQLINQSIDLFCRLNGIWRNKDKRLSKQLDQIDAGYASLIKNALAENPAESRYLDQLMEKMQQQLGGKRSKEWCLRSDLSL